MTKLRPRLNHHANPAAVTSTTYGPRMRNPVSEAGSVSSHAPNAVTPTIPAGSHAGRRIFTRLGDPAGSPRHTACLAAPACRCAPPAVFDSTFLLLDSFFSPPTPPAPSRPSAPPPQASACRVKQASGRLLLHYFFQEVLQAR